MKKLHKIGVATISSLAVAFAGGMTIGTISKSAYAVMRFSTHTRDIAKKLVDMNKNARCTSIRHRDNLNAIREWIYNQAIKVGVKDDVFGIDTYGNLWFDVEATSGCENWEPLILQGHMDMVVTGLTAEEMEVKPIDTVIDWFKGTVHSRGFKTTVGADNGFGIAAMLSLIQDKSIKHGPLRIFCSADEDSGMIGAQAMYDEYLNKPWNPMTHMGKDKTGRPIKYLLNLDAEGLGIIYEGCAGSATYNFKQNITPTAEVPVGQQLYIDVKGFKGGHSGENLVQDRANAEKCIYEILYELNKNKDIQIVQHYHPNEEGQDIAFKRNAIVSHARVIINTNGSTNDINQIITNKLPEWQKLYVGEDWSKVSITCGLSTLALDKYLETNISKQIINFIGPNEAPKENEDVKNLWYGYLPDGKGQYTMNANIAPCEIKYNEQEGKIVLTISSQTRTRGLSNFDAMEKCYNNIQNLVPSLACDVSSKYWPWDANYKNKDKMVQLAIAGYKEFGVTPNVVSSTGGIEPSWWSICNPELHCVGIGAKITDAHAVTETLYLDSIQPVIDVCKYIMLAMEKI